MKARTFSACLFAFACLATCPAYAEDGATALLPPLTIAQETPQSVTLLKTSVATGTSLQTVANSSTVEDLQTQIDSLRRLVEEQQKQILELQSRLDPSPPPTAPMPAVPTSVPAPVTPAITPSGERLSFYGFLRLDTNYDSRATNNGQAPFFVLSPDTPNLASRGEGVLTMTPRLSRLGINFNSPSPSKGDVTGKLELDWQNGGGVTAESRPLPRIRHAYLQWQRGQGIWLFGQTWDLISPLLPSPNDDTLLWNAGNLGDRRPQIRYTYRPQGRTYNAAVALGLTGAVDSQDLDGNGIRDGEDSARPNLQARIGWNHARYGFGVWAHQGWEAVGKAINGETSFPSRSLGLDWTWKPAAGWDVSGEVWTGRNLDDYRGGIGQGINAGEGRAIRSDGGWIELGYRPQPNHRVAAGFSLDDPEDGDLPDEARTKNQTLYLHNRWRVNPSLEMGINYLYWRTFWDGLATGTDHRINWFVQHNF